MLFEFKRGPITTDLTIQLSTLTPAAMSAPRKRKYWIDPVAMRMYTFTAEDPDDISQGRASKPERFRHSSIFPNMVGFLLCFYRYLHFVCVYMLFLTTPGECNHRILNTARQNLTGLEALLTWYWYTAVVWKSFGTKLQILSWWKRFWVFIDSFTFEGGRNRPLLCPQDRVLSTQSFGTCSCSNDCTALAVAQLTRLGQ